MSTALETWRDAAIGETREVLLSDGRPTALRVARWSDDGRRARWGEVYAGRVRSVDRRRRGGFIDLGLREQEGFLPLDAAGATTGGKARVSLREGEMLLARVTREAARGKSPVLQRVEATSSQQSPGRVAGPECDEELDQVKPADAETRSRIDEAIELALSPMVGLPGGGSLIIQPTAAMVVIDVDAGARAGAQDPEHFALELNIAAAQEAARQVRLRSLGGLIAIDFVSMRWRSNQKTLEEAVRAAFASDPWSIQFGGLSRFGVYQLSRAQLRAPLHEVLCDARGELSAESLALMSLRAIEREARVHGGRQIACTVSAEVKTWLDAGEIDWAEALTERIGPRWRIEVGAGARDMIDARPT
ncbi:MAG: ribonuclease E/G [Hyphomonadaceae bacterium]|nr:ribonuclease E/G [Hyphomonadaceae bacterium]